MFTYIIIALAILWFIGGVFSFGIGFASWQREFPLIARDHLISDFLFSILIGCLSGPFGILIFLSISGYHGFKFAPVVDADLNDHIAEYMRKRNPYASEEDKKIMAELAIKWYGV